MGWVIYRHLGQFVDEWIVGQIGHVHVAVAQQVSSCSGSEPEHQTKQVMKEL